MLVNYGILLFTGFTSLDVFGPLEVLNTLAWNNYTNLHIIAETLAPVTDAYAPAEHVGSDFQQRVVPTHTFHNAPSLDVLIVPGGGGTRANSTEIDGAIEFVRKRFPKLKNLITVCTGATIAARAGVLDGRKATTNKKAWTWATSTGPKVDWVAHARWVVDGKVWTTSGVEAGLDGTLAFIAERYNETVADNLAAGIEYTRERNSSVDPWATFYKLPYP